MTDKAWKAVERRVATYFRGTRTALSGRNSKAGTSADVIHEHLYVECKHRKRHTAVTLWDDTKRQADKEGKIPVVVLAEKNRPGFWVLVHSRDLKVAAAMSMSQLKEKANDCQNLP